MRFIYADAPASEAGAVFFGSKTEFASKCVRAKLKRRILLGHEEGKYILRDNGRQLYRPANEMN